MQAKPPFAASLHPRAGLTLLEVLVAGGILAIGLASVAALLPAASARLGQATQQDRAGMLAANARADCVARGLVAADIFPSTALTAACVFGELGGVSGAGITAPSALAGQRLGTPGGAQHFAEDPAFRWGAMLAPASGSATAGMPATLSIAVFRKSQVSPPTISLTGTSTSPRFQLTPGTNTGLRDEGNRRRFLPACSHVIALPATGPPRWVRVTSSWTMPGPITSGSENALARQSFVVLDPNPIPSGTNALRVVGFDGLLRVDQYPVTLD